jgi:dienelactone hydrolase
MAAAALAGAVSIAATTAPPGHAERPGAEARQAPAALRLPAPTGPQQVGHTALELTDRARTDPWVPTAGPRRLMVSLWYPARRAGGPRAKYMSPRESAALLKGQRVTGVPGAALSNVRTDAYEGAAPEGRPHRLPLVLMSPGFSLNRATLTSLGEELASRGYVVAAVDHTYETFGTTFPDGHTTTCVLCDEQQTPELARKIVRSRAADVSFVIDRLTARHPPWRGGTLIDQTRIGMAGHSIGGDAASAVIPADHRVRAGVNLDGTINTPLPPSGLHRPLLLLGTDATHKPGGSDPTWQAAWSRLTGWKRWLTVAGTQHSSFTDLHPLADQLGVDSGASISGARAVRVTRAYVTAFFDHTLDHRDRPLLNGPSAAYPEVTFWP